MAVVSSMMYLGQFSSPILIDTLGGHWMPHSPAAPFGIACCLCLMAAVPALMLTQIIRKKRTFLE